MKKIFSTASALMLGLLSLQAASYTITQFLDVLAPAGVVTSHVIDLDTESAWDPLSPGESDVIDATLVVGLLNPFNPITGSSGTTSVQIALDGNFWKQPGDFISIYTGGQVIVGYLNDDNELSIDLNPVGGPTRLTFASLTFRTGSGSQSVPDGGSMMALLGLSVLGLGWASRRVRA